MREHTIALDLTDNDPSFDGDQPIRIVASPHGVSIEVKAFDDCGSAEGHGSHIFIELQRGRLRLVVGSDFDNPTHVIDLESAKAMAPLLLAQRSLRQGGLTPLQEGRIYFRLIHTLNPATGKNFTAKEIAESLGV
jgi:hypothetical protein